jgi:hypothetical protein
MKNQLFHLKAVQTGTGNKKVEVVVGAGSGNFLKVGAEARAETNSFGSATRLCCG